MQCRLITAMGCRLNKPAASATVFNLSCIRVANLTASADFSRTTTCCELLAEITAAVWPNTASTSWMCGRSAARAWPPPSPRSRDRGRRLCREAPFGFDLPCWADSRTPDLERVVMRVQRSASPSRRVGRPPPWEVTVRILVTGASGWIGSAVVGELLGG